jgi:hypothetical protein
MIDALVSIIMFAELEIAEASNGLVFMICKHLNNLQSFAFVGLDLTYSGIVGLIQRKGSLRKLSIKDPRYITKHSMKLLSSQLINLKSLK